MLAFSLLAVFVLVLLFPYYWMVVTAFKPDSEINSQEGPVLWISKPTLSHFKALRTETANLKFMRWLRNSVMVSVSTTSVSVIIGTLAAYSLVRYRFFGSRVLGLGMFATYLVPPMLLVIPMLSVMQDVGLYGKRLSLVVVYPTLLVPFCTWYLMGFFRSIPADMEECARVDGATHLQAFYKVTLPLALPGIVSAGIFAFTLSWGEYLYARLLITSGNLWTLPVGVPSSQATGDVFFWGNMMAAAVVGSIPIAIVYALSMRTFVSGLTAGAVKG